MMMMLVQPADAAVPVPVQAPSSGLSLSSSTGLSSSSSWSSLSLSSWFHKSSSGSSSSSIGSPLSSALVPSWLALLAAIVLLSSARAALLYAHGRRSRKGIKGVVLVKEAEHQREEKNGTRALGEEKKRDSEDKASPSRPPSPPSSSATSSSTPSSTSIPSPSSPKVPARTSWFWGLVSWNRSSLPTLPLQVQRSTTSSSNNARLERLASDRGRTISMGLRRTQTQDIEQQQMIQRGLRSPPAFSNARFPSPSSPTLPYHQPPSAPVPSAPASMAKMIMSRHTFRRPAARPPPVRSARVVQYSRKYVPPPSSSPEDSDDEDVEGGYMGELEEGTGSGAQRDEARESEEEKLSV